MIGLRRLILTLMILLVLPVAQSPASGDSEWMLALRKELVRIDDETSGRLGVFVKRLEDGSELGYAADRTWYLASTTKIPVAIALLRKVEKGELSLERKLALQSSDYVDGGGDLLWKKPGTRISIGDLLEKMLTQSDSTAADLLIRLIGEKELNRVIREELGVPGFGPVTTLIQVRRDAFGEVHPKARQLSNLDFIELKKSVGSERRLRSLARMLGLKREDLKVKTLEEAFERYYEKGKNSASLSSFGLLLEKLQSGSLLSKKNTDLVLSLMEKMITGERRIKAGLPAETGFAQKTGTQLRRMCNMGIIRQEKKGGPAIVVAACLEKFVDPSEAERALRNLGKALARSGAL